MREREEGGVNGQIWGVWVREREEGGVNGQIWRVWVRKTEVLVGRCGACG